jgi:predicted nucleic acid-binding protein
MKVAELFGSFKLNKTYEVLKRKASFAEAKIQQRVLKDL